MTNVVPHERDRSVAWLFGRDGALFHASANGKVDLVAQLIEAGANVNAASINGVTPLHRAAQNGHLEVVRHLLTNGARPDAVSVQGSSAIDLARHAGHDLVVAVLSEHLARPSSHRKVSRS